MQSELKCEVCGNPLKNRRTSWCSLDCRFVSKRGEPDENGCIPWLGTKDSDGYGVISATVGRALLKAHRIAWERAFFPISDDRLCVMHACDNRICVNADHLMLGTSVANTMDRHKKGRSMSHERHHKAKLSQEDVRAIRASADNRLHRDIAAEYGVHRSSISRILRGDGWKVD